MRFEKTKIDEHREVLLELVRFRKTSLGVLILNIPQASIIE